MLCRRTSPHAPPPGWRFGHTDEHSFHYFFDDTKPHEIDRNREPDRWRRALKVAARASGESAIEAAETIAAPLVLVDTVESVVARFAIRDATDTERRALDSRLGLPAGAADAMRIRFRPNLHGAGGHRWAWVMDFHDGAGNIVGVQFRIHQILRDRKLSHVTNGLLLPHLTSVQLDDLTSPILCPEGASDVLALAWLGFTAVGRPSNTGGVEYLAEWLRVNGYAAGGARSSRPVYILGENDAKGDRWEGRRGAEDTAESVSWLVGRRIIVAMPPPGIKDARELLQSYRGTQATREYVRDVIEEQLTASAYDVQERREALTATSPVMLDFAPRPIDLASIPPAPAAPSCPNETSLLMVHLESGDTVPMWFACKTWPCDFCRPIKREHARATIRHHLREWGQPVHRSFVAAAEWRPMSLRLRRAKAEYFRLAMPDWRSVLVSTEPTPESVELGFEDATDRLCEGIGAVSADGQFTTSHRWSLLPDNNNDSRPFKRIGSMTITRGLAVKIADRHGADFVIENRMGLFWPRKSLTIKVDATINEADLHADLRLDAHSVSLS